MGFGDWRKRKIRDAGWVSELGKKNITSDRNGSL